MSRRKPRQSPAIHQKAFIGCAKYCTRLRLVIDGCVPRISVCGLVGSLLLGFKLPCERAPKDFVRATFLLVDTLRFGGSFFLRLFPLFGVIKAGGGCGVKVLRDRLLLLFAGQAAGILPLALKLVTTRGRAVDAKAATQKELLDRSETLGRLCELRVTRL